MKLIVLYYFIDNFYVLMAFLGLFKALYINCVFGAGMEVTSPALAIVMFMITTFCEGVGGIVFPYLSCKSIMSPNVYNVIQQYHT